MKDIESLLYGAIDMHVHAYPDVSLNHPQHRTNDDVIAQCRAAGMGGLVLKPHGWPSVGPVSYTHLDVYKRQVITLPKKCLSEATPYTHLKYSNKFRR